MDIHPTMLDKMFKLAHSLYAAETYARWMATLSRNVATSVEQTIFNSLANSRLLVFDGGRRGVIPECMTELRTLQAALVVEKKETPGTVPLKPLPGAAPATSGVTSGAGRPLIQLPPVK